MLWCSLEEQLQVHFDRFAPSVVVHDRVGRDQPHFEQKPKPQAPVPAAAAEPGAPRPSRRSLFAKVAAKGKQLGHIHEHDDA